MFFGVEIEDTSSIWQGEAEKILLRMKEAGCRQIMPYLTLESEKYKTEQEVHENDGSRQKNKRATGMDCDTVWQCLKRFDELAEDCNMERKVLHVAAKWLEEMKLETICELVKRMAIGFLVIDFPNDSLEGVFSPDSAAKDVTEKWYRLKETLQVEDCELLFLATEMSLCKKEREKTAFEVWTEKCGTKMALDIGILARAGIKPEQFLWNHADAVKAVFFRDVDRTGAEVFFGKGIIDLKSCFQFARAKGVLQVTAYRADGGQSVPYSSQEEMTVHDPMGVQEEKWEDRTVKALQVLTSWTGMREHTTSILSMLDVETGKETELHRFADQVIEAPNWLEDGKTLLYNADGRIFRYRIDRDEVEMVDTGFCVKCNNDHVPSPDNRFLAVSCEPPGESEGGAYESRIYVMPLEMQEPEQKNRDGEIVAGTNDGDRKGICPREVTGSGCSYLHGWSPDGKMLVYCAFRKRPEEEKTRIEICAVPASGGQESCLTDGVGYNDGPEYSPDGDHIWFNSTRSGLMQVWRMDSDGGNLMQMTDSDANNWFGHVSPDGKRVIYLTFAKGELEPHEHLPNMHVALHIMNYDGSGKRKLLDLFGGQGTINVNSWSPDSRKIAFVKYELTFNKTK